MRIFLLGATGHVGAHVVELALARGHKVTAYVRTPAKIERLHERLTITQGDALRVDQLTEALPRHDVVVSALGLPAREALRPSMRMAEYAATTVTAMQTAGIERLAIVSAAVLFPYKSLTFTFFRWLLRHHARDLLAMEAVVRGTPFEWTIARPPRLVETDDEAYREARDEFPGGLSMSFRAVAAFLLDSIEQRNHPRELVGLAGAR
jgi:putative NADH-flavin reductase